MDNITHLEIPTDEIKKGIALIETDDLSRIFALARELGVEDEFQGLGIMVSPIKRSAWTGKTSTRTAEGADF